MIKNAEALGLPAARTEAEVLAELRTLADRNQVLAPMIGLGYYGTFTPPVILRNVMENPAWYTAYTPYQPEISQGRLEALLNFQTMVADLTGLPTSGASLLDEGTAAAEAMALARRVGKVKNGVFLIDADALPQTIAVIETRAEPTGVEVVVADLSDGIPAEIAERGVFGVLIQYPGASGAVRDIKPLIDAAHELGAIVTVAADLLALTLLTSPGELGADIAVGTTQRFGVPMGFGGPHAGYMAVQDKHARSLPGRLVGVSVDADGNRAYRLALQTREQHIRREKATSNICAAHATRRDGRHVRRVRTARSARPASAPHSLPADPPTSTPPASVTSSTLLLRARLSGRVLRRGTARSVGRPSGASLPRTALRTRSGGGRHLSRRQCPVRGDDLPVRQQFTGVLEEQDTIAQQAPALFRVVCHQSGRLPVVGVGGGTGRLVLAHGWVLSLRRGGCPAALRAHRRPRRSVRFRSQSCSTDGLPQVFRGSSSSPGKTHHPQGRFRSSARSLRVVRSGPGGLVRPGELFGNTVRAWSSDSSSPRDPVGSRGGPGRVDQAGAAEPRRGGGARRVLSTGRRSATW
ncbi:Glycine dehydrogenase (decarboxylating) [Streptomyces narbonensis]